MADTWLNAGLLVFWGCWFSLVAFTNFANLLKVLNRLENLWQFSSGNFEEVEAAAQKYALPSIVTRALFVFLLAGQILAAVCFSGAVLAAVLSWGTYQEWQSTAYAVGLLNMGLLILGVEIFRVYEKQVTHLLGLSALLLSMVVGKVV